MYRFLPIILLLGIIFNCVCVVLFKIKSDRRVASEYQNLSNSLHKQVQDFSRDALRSIDLYFLSNSVHRTSNVSLTSTNSVSPRSPIYDVVGDWDYIFWRYGSDSFARVVNNDVSVDYMVGDKFPRGGTITAIHPDGICINDFFWINNINSPSYSGIGRRSNFDSRVARDASKLRSNSSVSNSSLLD